ncbi:MAG: hypothetical protein RQ767_04150 [Thermovirgaceae bacterium]|nr:hypothetical protein [Thermovirgaceae bacterium]
MVFDLNIAQGQEKGNGPVILCENGGYDILFDGNKAPAHPHWRERLLVHELAQKCSDQ